MLIGRRSLMRVAVSSWLGSLLGGFAGAKGKAPALISSETDPLTLVERGQAKTSLWVSNAAGPWERRAAADLVHYVERMTGAVLPIAGAAPLNDGPVVILGQAALSLRPELRSLLRRKAKQNPVVQGDAVIIVREKNRLYIAGSNDESHYFAMSWLLQHWGCRWYMPTPFGEHIPRRQTLSVGMLDYVYAPPFELRYFWLAWNADAEGYNEFRHRNFMSDARIPGSGQVLDSFTSDIAPPGKNHFNVPFSTPATAAHVAAKIEADYAAGKDISLAIADGVYTNDDPGDLALVSEYDRAMLGVSLTDAMMTLYNNVGRILRGKHPASRAKIGGLAYANVTMPPRKVTSAEPNIVMWLAPIDIDPNHAIDDARSPPRRQYGSMVRRWSEVVGGRLAIYDYDQSMLVWRDLPNPSHHVFAREAKIYREIGILGFGTESRGALATTFLNLFFRGQLMWNPDADVPAMLAEFYGDFYGSLSEPMARYWNRIFAAWDASGVTEHEHFVIPAIYTRELVSMLRADLGEAERRLTGSPSQRDGELIRERLRFTRLGFGVIAGYVEMITAAASEADYAGAVKAGERTLSARLELAHLHPAFTTRVIGVDPETVGLGPAWLPGEVEQLRRFARLLDGTDGILVARTPLTWSFRLAEPLPPDWRYSGPQGVTGNWDTTPAQLGTTSQGWRPARTDLYLQAQGVRASGQSIELGHYWYRTEVELPATKESVHLLFPGLFNEVWLYVNGSLTAHRPYQEPWWKTDYRFEWDIDVTHVLRPGRNVIALRGFNPHHFAGMFRRPFIYRPVESLTASSRRRR